MKERDHIAVEAMKILLNHIGKVPGYDEKAVAKDAYHIADLMILESKK